MFLVGRHKQEVRSHTQCEDPRHPRRGELCKQRVAAWAHGASPCAGWDTASCSTAPHQPWACIAFIHSFPSHPWQPPQSPENTHCPKGSQDDAVYGRPEWTAKCSLNSIVVTAKMLSFVTKYVTVLNIIHMLGKKAQTNHDWIHC